MLTKKDEKLIQLASKGGNDASLVLFDEIQTLEEEIKQLEKRINKKIDTLKKNLLTPDTVLESITGPQGIKGDEPSDRRLRELIFPLIPFPVHGKNGQDYILTEQDKIEIANKITIPIVEKIIEKPIITEVIKEIAKYETPAEERDKLENLKNGEKLSIQAIEGLAKKLEELDKKEFPIRSQKYGSIRTRYIDDETPTGTIDGSNTAFTISKTPATGSLKVYLGGVRQRVTEDYTFSGRTITFTTAPLTGSILLVDFRY